MDINTILAMAIPYRARQRDSDLRAASSEAASGQPGEGSNADFAAASGLPAVRAACKRSRQTRNAAARAARERNRQTRDPDYAAASGLPPARAAPAASGLPPAGAAPPPPACAAPPPYMSKRNRDARKSHRNKWFRRMTVQAKVFNASGHARTLDHMLPEPPRTTVIKVWASWKIQQP